MSRIGLQRKFFVLLAVLILLAIAGHLFRIKAVPSDNPPLALNWKMDMTAAPANDSSGNGLNSTTSLGEFNQAGKFGASFGFRTVADSIQLLNNTSLNVANNEFSISFWAKLKAGTVSANRRVVEKTDTLNRGYGVYLSGTPAASRICFKISAQAASCTTSTYSFTTAFRHIVIAVDSVSANNNVNFFLDGEFIFSSKLNLETVAAYTTTASTLFLGKSKANLESFQGYIDEFRIYREILSSFQTKELFAGREAQASTTPITNSSAQLLYHYNFDEIYTGTQIINDKVSTTPATSVVANTTPYVTTQTLGYGISGSFGSNTRNVRFSMPNNPNINFESVANPNSFSVSFWYRVISNPQNSESVIDIVRKDDVANANTDGWGIVVNGHTSTSSDLCAYIHQISSRICTNDIKHTTTSQFTPALFTMTYDGNLLKIYVNGVLKNSSPANNRTFENDAGPLTFGASNSNTLNRLDYFDEFKLFRGVLSDTEILNLYQYPLGAPTPRTVDPVLFAHYKFDDHSLETGGGRYAIPRFMKDEINGYRLQGYFAAKPGKFRAAAEFVQRFQSTTFEFLRLETAVPKFALNNPEGFSISFWHKGNDTSQSTRIAGLNINNINTGAALDWGFALIRNSLCFVPKTNASAVTIPEDELTCLGKGVSASNELKPNIFNHVVVTYRQNIFKYYINQKLVGTVQAPNIMTSVTGNYLICINSKDCTYGNVPSTIDDLRFYEGELNQSEIDAIGNPPPTCGDSLCAAAEKCEYVVENGKSNYKVCMPGNLDGAPTGDYALCNPNSCEMAAPQYGDALCNQSFEVCEKLTVNPDSPDFGKVGACLNGNNGLKPSTAFINCDKNTGKAPSYNENIPISNYPLTLFTHYKFDEPSYTYGGSVPDSGPYVINGIALSALVTSVDAFKIRALELSGLNYVYTQSSKIFADTNSGFSISVWLKSQNLPGSGIKVVNIQGGPGIFYTDQEICGYLNSTEGEQRVCTSIAGNLSDTTKYNHIVFTYDKVFMRLYVNNLLVNTINLGVADVNPGASLIIGGANFPTAPYTRSRWIGKIDDLLIYKGILSPSDVDLLFNGEYPSAIISSGDSSQAGTGGQARCGQICTINADCLGSVVSPGINVACVSGKCVNTKCVTKTVPGARCDCAVNTAQCGQYCGPINGTLCGSIYHCTYVKAPNCGYYTGTESICTPPGTAAKARGVITNATYNGFGGVQRIACGANGKGTDPENNYLSHPSKDPFTDWTQAEVINYVCNPYNATLTDPFCGDGKCDTFEECERSPEDINIFRRCTSVDGTAPTGEIVTCNGATFDKMTALKCEVPKPFTPWLITHKGPMYSGLGLIQKLPTTASVSINPFSYFLTRDLSNIQPVTTSGLAIVGVGKSASVNDSKRKTVIENYLDYAASIPASSVSTDWFSHLWNKIKDDKESNGTAIYQQVTNKAAPLLITGKVSTLSTKRVIFFGNVSDYDQNVSTNHIINGSFECDQPKILVFNGNLTIVPNISAPTTNSKSGCLFIVKGNVTVDTIDPGSLNNSPNSPSDNMSRLDGFFVINKNLYIENDPLDLGLVINGGVYAKTITNANNFIQSGLQRNAKLLNGTKPTYLIINDPRYQELFKDILGTRSYSIREQKSSQ